MPPPTPDLTAFGYAAAVRQHRARLDAATAQAASALTSRGVRCIVLKGAVTAEWLYADDEPPRHYADVDLFVSPDTIADAASTLTALGYAAVTTTPVDPRLRALLHSREYVREQDAVTLDLHWRLPGIDRDPGATWDVLVEQAETMTVAGAEILTLDERMRLVQLALHVAQRGPGELKALHDLRRGLEIAPDASWGAAFDLAGTLNAQAAVVAGLRSDELGGRLADRLGLPATSLEHRLQAADHVPRGTWRVLGIVNSRGWRARLRLIGSGLWPSREALAEIYPIAQRGAAGSRFAHAWHVAIAPIRVVRALVALHRVARRADAR